MVTNYYSDWEKMILGIAITAIPVIASYFSIPMPKTTAVINSILDFLDKSSLSSEDKLKEVIRALKLGVDKYNQIFDEEINSEKKVTQNNNPT